MRQCVQDARAVPPTTLLSHIGCEHKSNASYNGHVEVRDSQTNLFTNAFRRAVSEEEKAFALGLQVVMLRLFAYIPAPIVFGSVIDTTCLVWKPTQCQTEGTTCLLYDIEQFRLRYGLVAIAYKVGLFTNRPRYNLIAHYSSALC